MTELTEQNINEIKEQAARLLQEGLFGIGGAKKFDNQGVITKVVADPQKSNLVIRNPSLFDGVIYTDKTRLPPHRWSIFKSKSPVPEKGSILTHGFQLIFIMGYELDVRQSQFYELWYNSFSGTYVILDRYAAPVTSNMTYMNDAITEFVDIIAEENPTIKKSDLSSREQTILKNIALRNRGVSEDEEEARCVKMIVEDSTASRALLTNMLNQQVVVYQQTRMDSRAVKAFWQFWGKYVSMPQKYISTGLIGAVQKIIGRERIATFMVGVTLANRIDVEIWYVKDPKTGLGSYYVFDLTSLQIVASNIKTIRQAYLMVGKKLALPKDILSIVK